VLASFPSMSPPDGASHDDLIRGIAVRTMTQLGMKDGIDDAIAYAHQAYLEAKASFDPERGVPFEAHAAYRVRWGVLEGVRKMFGPSRRLLKLRKAMEAADAAAEMAGETRGRRGEPSRAAGALGALEELLNNLGMVFTAVEVAEAAQHGATEDVLITEMDIGRLKRAMTKLSKDHRELLLLVYYEDASLTDAGEKLRLSRPTAYRRHSDALAELRAILL
jgi:RNA polymerase sigma factor (sigma-70 family)